MRIRLLFVLLVASLISGSAVLAAENNENIEYLSYPNRGYRGFFDVMFGKYGSDMNMCSYQISTTHGFQFNKKLFLGLGSIVEIDDFDCHRYNSYCDDTYVCLVDYFNAHFDILPKKVSPFIDARLGYRVQINVNNGDDYKREGMWQNMQYLYLSPIVGVRCGNFSLSVSYENNRADLFMKGYFHDYEIKKNFNGLQIFMQWYQGCV